MYKTKVWIHLDVNDILKNESPFWVDMTFVDKPKSGFIFEISDDLVEDLKLDDLWKSKFGSGRYVAKTADELWEPSVHDGFSYCIMAVKLK